MHDMTWEALLWGLPPLYGVKKLCDVLLAAHDKIAVLRPAGGRRGSPVFRCPVVLLPVPAARKTPSLRPAIPTVMECGR